MPHHSGDTTQLERLLPKLALGSEPALNELLTLTSKRLRHLAQKKLSGFQVVRSQAETDDVLQEALLKLSRALKECPPHNPYEYLGLAALQIQRVLLDLAKKYRGKLPAKLESDPTGPGTTGLGTDDWATFHEAVSQLPDPPQLAFRLHYYLGLTQVEIAQQLKQERSSISRQIRRAKFLLMQRLSPGPPDSGKHSA